MRIYILTKFLIILMTIFIIISLAYLLFAVRTTIIDRIIATIDLSLAIVGIGLMAYWIFRYKEIR